MLLNIFRNAKVGVFLHDLGICCVFVDFRLVEFVLAALSHAFNIDFLLLDVLLYMRLKALSAHKVVASDMDPFAFLSVAAFAGLQTRIFHIFEFLIARFVHSSVLFWLALRNFLLFNSV